MVKLRLSMRVSKVLSKWILVEPSVVCVRHDYLSTFLSASENSTILWSSDKRYNNYNCYIRLMKATGRSLCRLIKLVPF
jgi:hypothetical protein